MRIEFCQVIEPGSFNDHASGILQGDSRYTQFADKKPVAKESSLKMPTLPDSMIQAQLLDWPSRKMISSLLKVIKW